jgi:hypothetical protein
LSSWASLLKLNSLQRRDHASFNFSKPFQIVIEFFFFFSNKLIFGGLILLGRNRFSLWLGFFFFLFFFSNKPIFGGLIPLGGLGRLPNSPYGWAGPALLQALHAWTSVIGQRQPFEAIWRVDKLYTRTVELVVYIQSFLVLLYITSCFVSVSVLRFFFSHTGSCFYT